jgi:hypothetical protein
MKSFKQYLTESIRTYEYKIKIAGEPTKNWLDLFCHNLQKFDPVKISDPKSTPIQKDPYGFPNIKNQSITIIDVEFRYPVIEPMVKQLGNLLNYDENNIRLVQKHFDDGIENEAKQYENQLEDSPILDKNDMSDSGKDASKEYAEQYMSRIREAEKKDKLEMPFSAPRTKDAEDFRKVPGNTKSPMTSINRSERPATGASKK